MVTHSNFPIAFTILSISSPFYTKFLTALYPASVSTSACCLLTNCWSGAAPSYEGDCEPSSRPRALDPEVDREADTSLVVRLHCPGLASLRWVVKLYSLVLGGLGLVLSFAWVCFHLYVLSMTSLVELRQHR